MSSFINSKGSTILLISQRLFWHRELQFLYFQKSEWYNCASGGENPEPKCLVQLNKPHELSVLHILLSKDVRKPELVTEENLIDQISRSNMYI